MAGTVYDEVEARSRVYRERIARAYASWCRYGAQSSVGDLGGGYRPVQDPDPFATDVYVVLGCSPHAPDSELIVAYRRAAKRFHPDCAEGLGLAAYRHATEAMARINAAWDCIRRMRCL